MSCISNEVLRELEDQNWSHIQWLNAQTKFICIRRILSSLMKALQSLRKQNLNYKSIIDTCYLHKFIAKAWCFCKRVQMVSAKIESHSKERLALGK